MLVGHVYVTVCMRVPVRVHDMQSSTLFSPQCVIPKVKSHLRKIAIHDCKYEKRLLYHANWLLLSHVLAHKGAGKYCITYPQQEDIEITNFHSQLEQTALIQK